MCESNISGEYAKHLKYTAALQRAVELWYHGQPIPEDVRRLCSYHVRLLTTKGDSNGS